MRKPQPREPVSGRRFEHDLPNRRGWATFVTSPDTWCALYVSNLRQPITGSLIRCDRERLVAEQVNREEGLMWWPLGTRT
jgi:hypothetical protein